MKICIVGGGLTTYFLSRSLISKGHSLTIINKNKEECEWFARRLKAVVVHGDGTYPVVIQDAVSDGMDAVLAITPKDEDNFIICKIAQRKQSIAYTFALLNDPDNEKIFQELGIKAVFSPTRLLSNMIEQRAGYETVTTYIPFAEGKVNLLEIVLPENTPVAGKKIQELKLPENCLIVSILRDQKVITPKGKTELYPLDRIGIVSPPEVHSRIVASLTGERGL